jgi:hypothetical protein
MKIKNGAKYRILCDYTQEYGKEKLKAGDNVEVDHISCWNGSDTSTRYGLVYFKDSFPIFAHIFEFIAEEKKAEI